MICSLAPQIAIAYTINITIGVITTSITNRSLLRILHLPEHQPSLVTVKSQAHKVTDSLKSEFKFMTFNKIPLVFHSCHASSSLSYQLLVSLFLFIKS